MSLTARLEYALTALAHRPVDIETAQEAILAAIREAEKLETNLAIARAASGIARVELLQSFPPLVGDA